MSDLNLEIKQAISQLEQNVAEKLTKSTQEVAAFGSESKATREELKAAANELESVVKQQAELKSELTELLQSRAADGKQAEVKTGGQEFIDSAEFKNFAAGQSQKVRVELKNTIVNSGNDTSRHEQLGGVVPGAFRPLTVMPTVAQGAVNSNTVYYSRELGWTNAAAGTAEGAAKPESTLTFEEIDTPVRTIPTFLKVSKQALDDSTFLASYIDRRLRHAIDTTVESQIVNGDGTGQNLSGWLATGNSTVTSPLLTVDIFGLANKMLYEIVSADYTPDFFYMNPQDWGNLETARRATGDNAFIAASGAVNYVDDGKTKLLWGLPVVVSNAIPVGTVICKSMDADMYGNRSGTVVEMFEQDGNNVTTNLITVRAETRGAEMVFTPAAIRTGDITAITAA